MGLLLLTACANRLPVDASGESMLSGRLALRVDGQPERSVSAGFELSGGPQQGALLLTGPLGTTAAVARWSAGQAVLTQAGTETRHPDLDTLAAAALGEPLPMAALFDWLRGRPWPGAPSAPTQGTPGGFDQLGWHVDLSQWAQGLLSARRVAPPAVLIRIKLEPPA